MAPWVEGEKVLRDEEEIELKRVNFGSSADVLKVCTDGDRLKISIYYKPENDNKEISGFGYGSITLDHKESFAIGDRKIEWREE